MKFNFENIDTLKNECLVEAIKAQQQGHFDIAEKVYRKHLATDKNNGAVLHLLGLVLYRKKKYKRSINFLNQAIELMPKKEIFYVNLAMVYKEEDNNEEFIKVYEQGIKNNPKSIGLYEKLGIFYRDDLFDLDNAKKCFDKIIEIDSKYQQAYSFLGTMHYRNGEPYKALELYQKSIDLDADVANAHLNKGLVSLAIQDFETGWSEYEWRLEKIKPDPVISNAPRWNGEDVGDSTILVHFEQGFGDSVQFIRYIRLVKEKCGKVIFICQKELFSLFQSIKEIDSLISDGSGKLADLKFDYQVPLMSLPGVFKTNFKNIPQILKMNPNNKICEKWKKINYNKNKLKVGLCWSGNSKNTNNKNRSMNFLDIIPLLKLENIDFYSLQKDIDLAKFAEGNKLIDLSTEFASFADTAALIENLDVVVSVDTVIAHLAGSLNKRTLLLLPRYAEWRWWSNINYSPWYSNMNVMRQSKMRSWSDVIEKVKNDLCQTIIKQ